MNSNPEATLLCTSLVFWRKSKPRNYYSNMAHILKQRTNIIRHRCSCYQAMLCLLPSCSSRRCSKKQWASYVHWIKRHQQLHHRWQLKELTSRIAKALNHEALFSYSSYLAALAGRTWSSLRQLAVVAATVVLGTATAGSELRNADAIRVAMFLRNISSNIASASSNGSENTTVLMILTSSKGFSFLSAPIYSASKYLDQYLPPKHKLGKGDNLFNTIQNCQSTNHLTKDRMLKVQMRGWSQGDEELRGVGVLAVVGHAQHTSAGM